MHDTRIEDLLRRTLHDEAETLPLSVTTGMLQRRLTERRSQAHANRRWLAAAAIAAVVFTGGAALLTQFRGEVPPIGASPSPSASPSPLPDASALLADHPDANLRLEHSVGPAGGPTASAASSPATAPAPIEVGRVRFTGPFVIAVACIGSGQLLVEVTTPTFDVPYTQAVAPCDGKPVLSEYLAAPIDPASTGDTFTVTVADDASWRLAVGEYPASLMDPPAFAPVELTAGWNVVSNGGATLVSTKTGAHITMPDAATRIGVFVQCQGTGAVSISVTGSPPSDVACDPSGVARRVEFPAVGGQPLALEATVGGERVWVRLIVEANADIATTYPSAPPLPAAVAAAPYAVPDPSVVAFGTVGSDRQRILPMPGARPGMPAGDLLPVAFLDPTNGARLELVSVSKGAVLRTLATAPAPSQIFDSWADATHDQVFYAMAAETAVEFHRIGADGSDDTIVATVDRGSTGFSADLAVDDSVFVVDACFTGGGCTRTIVDGTTGVARQVDRASEPVCRIFGIVDGTIVGSTRPVCSEDAPTNVIGVAVDGGRSNVLIEGAAGANLDGAFVASTSEGPKLVLAGPVGPDETPWDVLDLTTGETAMLPPGASGTTPLMTAGIRLPDGWVLLTGGGLGDFPWQRAFDRPTPVLVNLVTDERIELVNLPHWTGNYPG